MGLENTGEGAIRDLLTRQFPGEEFHLMNNLTLPCSDGTTQIDHVLLSRYGVFVIETKHYTGWIFANADSAKWTQVIYQVRNQFQNPIRQNFKHVQVVRRLLDFVPNEHIHSLVVFTGDAEFKTPKPDGVFSPLGLVSHLHGFAEEVLTVDQLHTAVGRLECARRLISGKTDTEHQPESVSPGARMLGLVCFVGSCPFNLTAWEMTSPNSMALDRRNRELVGDLFGLACNCPTPQPRGQAIFMDP